MSWIATGLSAIVGLAPSPGWATPPQTVSVREQLVGENDTHLFLLRRIDDNLGFHHTRQTDLLLIARDLSTGRDDATWPVMSVLDHGPYYEDYGQPRRVEDLSAEDRMDPFAILLRRQARLIAPEAVLAGPGPARITADEIQVVGRDGTPTHGIPLSEAVARMDASLKATRSNVPARKLEAGEDPLLAMADIEAAERCRIGASHRFAATDGRSVYSVRLDCSDRHELAQLSLYVVVPPVALRERLR